MQDGSYVEEVARTVLRRHPGRDVTALNLDDIAVIMGTSRSTLIRRIGTRRALDESFARLGAHPARESAADRAIAVAARMYGAHGVGEVTLEMVAAEAECTVQAIQAQLGGRNGLLAAVLDRYTPLPGITAVLADPPPGFDHAVRALYEQALEAMMGETRVLAALFAEIAARPGGALAAHVRASYAPRFVGLMMSWIAGHQEQGTVRPMPAQTLLALFTGPALALSSASFATGAQLDRAERAQLASDLAEAFCRAVRM